MAAFATARETALLPVSRAQAVQLFQQLTVVTAEIVEGIAAWTFAGGIVLILDHTVEPAAFRLGLDVSDAWARPVGGVQ